jgi:hypothetical protein
MLLYKVTVPQYLHMDKQDLERLIQWQENNKFSKDKYINQIQVKVLYQEPFNSYGKKLNNIKVNILSKQVILKYIISKLKIY